MEGTMRHTKDRGYAEESGPAGAQAGDGLTPLLSSALSQFFVGETPDRTYKGAVESTALAIAEPVSLWRMGDEGPSLVAFKAANKTQSAEEMLAAMKKSVSIVWEQIEARPFTGRHVQAEETEKDGLALVLIWTSAGIWGALVYGGASGEKGASFADSIAVALGLVAEREALHEEVGTLRGRIAAAERDRDATDRYVAIGQLAAHSYNELEAILVAVGNELGKGAHSGVSGSAEECLSELRRARDIIAEQLELARLEMPVLRMSDLNGLIQESMREQEDRINSKGLRLLKRLSSELPKLLLDGEKVKVAVAKVLGAAASRSVPEGWLRVETALQDGDVVLQVTWEEKGSPGDGCDDMFVPFGSMDKGGMGLMVASQIIREHGGGVRVKRFESGSSALILDFPVQSNQDRRHSASRRNGLDRRRISEP
jgi:signal transduction histidine kinase